MFSIFYLWEHFYPIHHQWYCLLSLAAPLPRVLGPCDHLWWPELLLCSIALTLRKYLTLHTAAAEESYRQANDPMIIEKWSVCFFLQNVNNFPQQHIRPWSPVHTVHVSGHWWCTEPPAQTGGWSPSGHCAALFIVTRPQSQAPHEP